MKTLVGTMDPDEEPCPICNTYGCRFHNEDDQRNYIARENSRRLGEELRESNPDFNTQLSQCPDNNPDLIPDIEIEVDLPEIPISSIKEMIAWFPKDRYICDEDEHGYIIYYDPKVK